MMKQLEKEDSEIPFDIYKFVDQAYSWALDGMKFVSTLKMQDCTSLESCQEMIDKFDRYMESHPTLSDEEFVKVENSCKQYGDEKGLRRCDFARVKCQETSNLFKKRRELLEKIKRQLQSSQKKRYVEEQQTNDKENVAGSRRNSRNSENENSNLSINNSSNIENLPFRSAESFRIETRPDSTTIPDHITFDKSTKITRTNTKPSRKVLKKSASAPKCGVSHVQSHSGVTLTIGSPVQVEVADDSRGKSKLTLIIEELIATEKDYVQSLNYVVENYFPEMCRLDIPQALRCKRNFIFGNIEKIAEFHSRYFLRDLKSCYDNPLRVAKVFQMHKDALGLYALYSKNKPQSDTLLLEHGNEFFKKRQNELGDKMDLASYLLKPVQRMGKYALILHAMAKKCTGEEKRNLQEAEELVKFQLRHGNDLLTMDSIRDCDVNLKEQGKLLRQDQFVIFCGRHKIMRRVFLFEDLILFSKPIPNHGGHDTYQYKCSYKTTEIGLTENIGESGFKFEIWFRRRRPQTTQDRFVLQGSSRSVKRAWVEEIRNMLWKQAVRNKDHRRLEMSSMGVGSKPHLNLAASSENRITDRSVVVLPSGGANFLAARLAKSRMRSSIAVSHFTTEQQKRPYSVVSSSSSSSSIGSASLLPSLHLTTWQSKSESNQSSTSSPPSAYYDFHVIAEDGNENDESHSETTSSSPSSHEIGERSTNQFMETANSHQLTVQ